MDSRKLVLKETGIIALGELIGSGVMVGVFAALGYFSMPVVWGALFGSLTMTVNYFFMAVTVSQAADRAAQGQVDSAKKSVQLSSTVRLVCIGVAMALAIKLGTNPIATILPLAFTRPILMLAEFFRKKGD